jgi:hypothetical protein
MKFLKNTQKLNDHLNQMFNTLIENDYVTENHREWFIDQTLDYGTNTCKTYSELDSFIDGLMMVKPDII